MLNICRVAVALLAIGCANNDNKTELVKSDTSQSHSALTDRLTTNLSADSARRFTQSFYDWYVPLGERAADKRFDSLLMARGHLFAAPLRTALKEDMDAQQGTSELVSVIGDYDPFLNSQDPCKRYEARESVVSHNGYAVAIYGVCDRSTAALAVIVDVERNNETWIFTNFHIPEQPKFDLLSALAAAKSARAAPSTRRAVPKGARP